MNKVLILTNHYLDNKTGGSRASVGFINVMARVFQDVTAVYPVNGSHDEGSNIDKGVKLIPCSDPRPKWVKGMLFYLGIIHRFEGMTRKHLKDTFYDVIVFDTSIVSWRLMEIASRHSKRIITIHHNFERDYFRDNQQNILIRIPHSYFVNRAERESIKGSWLNLTLTESDRLSFIDYYRDSIDEKSVFNFGVFVESEHSEGSILHKQRKRNKHPQFIITGSLAFSQSITGIIKFLKDYYPLMRDCMPSFSLVIAGSNPARSLTNAVLSCDNIFLVRNPQDLRKLVANADYYICPVDSGSGIKMRILDPLSEGVLVLTHEISSSGYEYLIEKDLIFTYNSPETFVESLTKMVYKKVDRSQIVSEYLSIFSYRSGEEKLTNIMKQRMIFDE